MASPTRVCTVLLAFDGDRAQGEIRINVDLVRTRSGRLAYRVATPSIPGVDEMGLTRWAGTREAAREAYKALRATFPRHTEVSRQTFDAAA